MGKLILITPDGNTKQFGRELVKTNLKYTDSGLYFCSGFDQNGDVVKERVMIGILSVFPRKNKIF